MSAMLSSTVEARLSGIDEAVADHWTWTWRSSLESRGYAAGGWNSMRSFIQMTRH
jgi:hypothetical protein